jgi:hypothetical protein
MEFLRLSSKTRSESQVTLPGREWERWRSVEEDYGKIAYDGNRTALTFIQALSAGVGERV